MELHNLKNNKEELLNRSTGPTGATGATGDIGPTGPTGAAPVLTIGAVITGDPGTEATASITGTSPNFILNLTIPQGPTARFNNSSNNIIHKFKQITFKFKKIKYH